jgi:hypothetical protein
LAGIGGAYASAGALLFLVPAVIGGIAVLTAGWLGVVVLSAGLEVDVAALRLHWLGHERLFRLVPGALTRVSVGGGSRPRLRARLGALGWALGSATLNDEQITVVRLAAGRPLVMIPTDQGRLAVAAADERELVEALTAAARVQLRLDQAVAMARPVPIAVSAPPSAMAGAAFPLDAAGLTGIERARLEERLATRRTAATVAAESERRAASEAVRTGSDASLPAPVAPMVVAEALPRPSRPRQRSAWHRPAWLSLGMPGLRPAPSAPRVVSVASRPWAARAQAALPRVRLPSLPVPSIRLPIPRWARGRGRSLLVVAPPVLGGLTWLVADRLQLLPAEAEGIRVLALAVVLGGPVALAGSILAWIRFPRLAGLVAASGLLALALVGRALVG